MTVLRALVCAYEPCSEEFTTSHPKARYHDPKCKAADWKVRRGYGARRAVRTDARGPGGVQVSWGPALDSLTQHLEAPLSYAFGCGTEGVRRAIEAALFDAVPARQRARLLERGAAS